MNTLALLAGSFLVSVVFVNTVTFGVLKMPRGSISFGTLFLIQIGLSVFIIFMYKITQRKY
jgi:hypothetical protein